MVAFRLSARAACPAAFLGTDACPLNLLLVLVDGGSSHQPPLFRLPAASQAAKDTAQQRVGCKSSSRSLGKTRRRGPGEGDGAAAI